MRKAIAVAIVTALMCISASAAERMHATIFTNAHDADAFAQAHGSQMVVSTDDSEPRYVVVWRIDQQPAPIRPTVSPVASNFSVPLSDGHGFTFTLDGAYFGGLLGSRSGVIGMLNGISGIMVWPDHVLSNVSIDTDSDFRVGGKKVVGSPGDPVANATNSVDVVKQFNLLLDRLREHGLIAR